jgi:DNA-binding NarL/FixJ family response regulator
VIAIFLGATNWAQRATALREAPTVDTAHSSFRFFLWIFSRKEHRRRSGASSPCVNAGVSAPQYFDLMENIRVIIVEEQPLFREGIRATLEQMGDCVIVGDSTDPEVILELARTENPDVVLLDTSLNTGDPLEIARQVLHITTQVAIIMLTPSEDEERLFQSIKVGASAYYTRNITKEELSEAVRKVSVGEYLINDDVLSKPQLASRVLKSFRELAVEEEALPTKDMYSPLSTREVEILDYIARGNSNKEIAKSLKISDQTVKNHITSILKKLSVNDRTAAVVHALRHGWIKMEEV